MIHAYRSIDAHCAGQPLRLIVSGLPTPPGRSMLKRQQWLGEHADHVRRAIVLEPRGHAAMVAAMLTEPEAAGSHAGAIFMHAGGYSAFCGHGLMALTTIAIQHGLITDVAVGEAAERVLAIDTVAGTIRTRARLVRSGSHAHVDAVAVEAPPAYVSGVGCPITLGQRQVRVDVAYGGGFFAMVDAEAVGLALEPSALPDLRRYAGDIRASLHRSTLVSHPEHQALSGLEGVIFTGPPRDPEAHLRNATVFADGAVDRSPCGGGTAAVMAVLEAMGLLPLDTPFVFESLIGTRFRGRILRRARVGDREAVVCDVEGSAWVTGEHEWFVDDEDPLHEGFTL